VSFGGQSGAESGLFPNTLTLSCQLVFYHACRYLMMWAGSTGFPTKTNILTQLLKLNEKNHLLYKSNSQVVSSLKNNLWGKNTF
jgi:hypothetical protein